MRKGMNILLMSFLTLSFVTACGKGSQSKQSQNHMQKKNSEAKMSETQKGKNPVAVFTTSMGTFKVELFEDKVPVTAGNFIKLAESGFYNGVIFHRVIADFMIQGGDPTGTGSGGPGYTIPDEFDPSLKHDSAGILSMANAGPNTGGSQFFITLKPTPWLDGHHAVFGKVIENFDVVDAIGKVKTASADRPVTPVVIEKVEIIK